MAAPVAAGAAKLLKAQKSRRQMLQLAGLAGAGLLGVGMSMGVGATVLAASLTDEEEVIDAGPREVGDGPLNPNGWAWPSNMRAITQGFHEWMAIDLASADGGPLYSPYKGVVVRAGGAGIFIPEVCRIYPSWWRGENHIVIVKHQYQGRTMWSAHNHIRPGSSLEVGVQVGSVVRAGQPVALSGMSGCTSAPHTHFTLSSTERSHTPDINPFPFIGYP